MSENAATWGPGPDLSPASMPGTDLAGPTAPARSLDPAFEAFYSEAQERRGGQPLALREWLDLAEAWRIMRALRECRGNRSAAARALGIGRRTLYTKMEKLGISSVWDVFRSS